MTPHACACGSRSSVRSRTRQFRTAAHRRQLRIGPILLILVDTVRPHAALHQTPRYPRVTYQEFRMTHFAARLLEISLVTPGFSACAAQPDQHKGHHPPASAAARSTTADSTADAARIDKQTTAMRAMHDKMVAARTPRSALR